MMKLRSLVVGALLSALLVAAAQGQSAGQLDPGQVWGNFTASPGPAQPSNIPAGTNSTVGVLGCDGTTTDCQNGKISVGIAQMGGGIGASPFTVWTGNGTWNAPQGFPYTPLTGSLTSLTLMAKLQLAPISCEEYQGGCTAGNIAQAITDSISKFRCVSLNSDYTISASVTQASPAGSICLTGHGGLTGSTGMDGPLLDIKDATNGVFIGPGLAFNCASQLSIPAAIKIWADGAGGSVNTKIFDPIFANCRRALQYGDPNFTDFTVDNNVVQGGYTFNIAQGVAAYGSQTGVFLNNFSNQSASTLSSSLIGTCTGSTLAASSITGFLAKDDILTGSGISTVGTHIVVQTSGPTGGAGNYTLSASCSSAGASLTATPAPYNNLVVGATFNVRDGYVLNSNANGELFHGRPVNSGTFGFPSARISVIGTTIEGADIIFNTDNDGVSSPGTGRFSLSNPQGDFSGNTHCYITTDTLWTGNIAVEGGSGLFSTTPRTQKNICANNSGANIYFDLSSFGADMLQGTAGVSGGTQYFFGTTGISKAWASFVGSSGSVQSSYNVSSVVRNSAGDYTINFSSPMPNANYAVLIGVEGGTSGVIALMKPGTRSTTSVEVECLTSGLSSLADPQSMSIQISASP